MDNKLREMDAKVHKALYPDDDVSHILNFGPRLTYVGDRVFRTNSRRWMRLPHYTTDIGAWEPVYALHPEWRWMEMENFDGSIYTTLIVPVGFSQGQTVRADEATGLAAYALGRARCVIAWAEEKR